MKYSEFLEKASSLKSNQQKRLKSEVLRLIKKDFSSEKWPYKCMACHCTVSAYDELTADKVAFICDKCSSGIEIFLNRASIKLKKHFEDCEIIDWLEGLIHKCSGTLAPQISEFSDFLVKKMDATTPEKLNLVLNAILHRVSDTFTYNYTDGTIIKKKVFETEFVRKDQRWSIDFSLVQKDTDEKVYPVELVDDDGYVKNEIIELVKDAIELYDIVYEPRLKNDKDYLKLSLETLVSKRVVDLGCSNVVSDKFSGFSACGGCANRTSCERNPEFTKLPAELFAQTFSKKEFQFKRQEELAKIEVEHQNKLAQIEQDKKLNAQLKYEIKQRKRAKNAKRIRLAVSFVLTLCLFACGWYFGFYTFEQSIPVEYKTVSGGISVTGVKDDGTEHLIIDPKLKKSLFVSLSVTSIADSAFRNNNTIKTVVLPDTVTEIGNQSFANSSSLIKVSLGSENPPEVGENVFSGSNNLLIYVPSDAFETYIQNPQWAVYADFIVPELENDKDKFFVYFDTDGGSEQQPVINISSGELINVNHPTKFGYIFDGWYSASSPFDISSPITKDLKLVAKWVLKSSVLTFEYNGATSGATKQSKEIFFSTPLGELPLPIKTGFSFKGWYDDANFTGEECTGETVYMDIVDFALYAKWEIIIYTVTLDYQGGGADTIVELVYGETLSTKLPANVTKGGGNTFGGWWTEIGGKGIQYDSQTDFLEEKDITLYAKWEATIILDYQGGDIGELPTDLDVVYNAAIEGIPGTVARSNGYIFDGWWTEIGGGGQQVLSGNVFEATGSIALYAKWKTTITLDPDGGIVDIMKIDVVYGKALGFLPKATKTGVTFEGWFSSKDYLSIQKFTDQTVYYEDGAITLFAKWAVTLVFNYDGADGGVEDEYITVVSGEIIGGGRLPTPTKTGHFFGGWFEQENGGGSEYTNQTVFVGTVNKMAHAFWITNRYTIVFNAANGTPEERATLSYGDNLILPLPNRYGYNFDGWFTADSNRRVNEKTVPDWGTWLKKDDILVPITINLNANWVAKTYVVTFNKNGGTDGTASVTATFDAAMPSAIGPTRIGYNFDGYIDVDGIKYYNSNMTSARNWDKAMTATLTAVWTVRPISSVTASPSSLSVDSSATTTITASGGSSSFSYSITSTNHPGVTVSLSANKLTLTRTAYSKSGTVTVQAKDSVTGITATCNISYKTVDEPCIAPGTLITLADGSMVPVENLTGDELLLVWNLFAGDFDIAPILFIDSDEESVREIIHLYFSDGTEVKVLYEHAFWNFELGEYVFLRNDAAKYIGDWFNKQVKDNSGNFTWTKVQLVDVRLYFENTTAWSPVTFSYLCYYVNGMLSMPGSTQGLINIFDVVCGEMQYDQAKLQADIDAYGLFEYADFADIIPEIIFDAFNGPYLKVAMGKGLIDWETIHVLVEKYALFLFDN